MKNLNKTSLMIGLAVYLASAVGSYAFFNRWQPSNKATQYQQQSTQEEEKLVEGETSLTSLLEIDPEQPKDRACPLNGQYYTQTEQESWEKRRPIAVMIENHPDARPQSGLDSADLVFEAIAEGGVTRFMPLYYCEAQAYDVILAPIRSARTYFVDWASGFNRPLYAHVGGANLPGPADALGQISDYGWVGENDLNQFSIGYPTFVRDYNRLDDKELATEHTMVTSTEKLWEVGEKREWTNLSRERKYGYKVIGGEEWQKDFTPWEFQDSAPDAGDVDELSYSFWSGYDDYALRWAYNPENNSYRRFMGGEAHLDLNKKQQIEASNVIVLKTAEKGPIDELKHMLYETTGSGEAVIFKNGAVTEATWTKKTRTDELQFVDDRGQVVPLARGLTWISVVNNLTEVEY